MLVPFLYLALSKSNWTSVNVNSVGLSAQMPGRPKTTKANVKGIAMTKLEVMNHDGDYQVGYGELPGLAKDQIGELVQTDPGNPRILKIFEKIEQTVVDQYNGTIVEPEKGMNLKLPCEFFTIRVPGFWDEHVRVYVGVKNFFVFITTNAGADADRFFNSIRLPAGYLK